MDIRKVKKLIELLQASGIAEIEVREGEESVRISAHPQSGAPHLADVPEASMVSTGTSPGEPPVAVPQEDESHIVKSPMVGIFYASPAPDQPPFVTIGQAVKRGEVLCIIEAMKILNQIEADMDGMVKKIFIESGEPVEYGQALFTLG